MHINPNNFGYFILCIFCLLTIFANLVFKYLKLKNESNLNIQSHSSQIQKLYHSVFELEELIEILIEELDDYSLSRHHQEQKNRIRKSFLLHTRQI